MYYKNNCFQGDIVIQINPIQIYNQNSVRKQKNTNFGHLIVREESLNAVQRHLDKSMFDGYVKHLKFLQSIPLNLINLMKNVDILNYYDFGREFKNLSKTQISDCASWVINDFIKAIDAKEECDFSKPNDKIPERENYTLKMIPQPQYFSPDFSSQNNVFYGMGLRDTDTKNIRFDSIDKDVKLSSYDDKIKTFYYECNESNARVKNRFHLPQTEKDLFNQVRGVIVSHLYSVFRNNLKELNEAEKQKNSL